jgi:D-sedoheptulose 7-phosphate isomerase
MNHHDIAREWARLLDEFFLTRGETLDAALAACAGALAAGRKILAFGNGGSAAEAQHFVAELVNKFRRPRPALRAVTLSADTSVLTSIGNDSAFEAVFSRQIEALGDAGDVALALSTSGTSPNVVAALKAARAIGMVTIGLTGRGGGAMAGLCDHLLAVASEETPRIQEIHLFLLHHLAGELERRMFP